MFGKDIIAWCLIEDTEARPVTVQEVHLLKSRDLWIGQPIPKWRWERGQRWKPYPAHLRKPVDVVLMEAA